MRLPPSLAGIFFGGVLTMQLASAYTNNVYFHFQGIGLLGNNVIVKITGENGNWQQWRLWLAPLIGNEFTRTLDPAFGFKNGETVTACLTDVGNGIPVTPSCYTTNVDFNGGTDFYLTVPGT